MITVEAGNVDTRPLELDAPLTLDIVKQALIEEFRIENVEVDIESDTFKVGRGVTSLMSSATPCVVIYNRKYRKKYYSLVLEIKSQYNRTFAYLHMGGTSKNSININMSQRHVIVNESGVNVYRPGFVGEMLGNRAKKNMIDEDLYYDIAFKIVSAALAEATVNPGRYANTTQRNTTYSHTSEKQTYTPPSQTRTNSTQTGAYQPQSKKTYTQSEPIKKSEAQKTAVSESKEKTANGWVYVMWLVWISFALLNFVVEETIEALQMNLFGIVLLYCGQKLIIKSHPVWAWVPILMGGWSLSMMWAFEFFYDSIIVCATVMVFCPLIFWVACYSSYD